MEKLFQQLNEQQIEAVAATEGYVRIIAGAGSGKTKTLTHRYAFLVKAAGIHPANILCVTFTSKAAGEMKRRVRSLIGDGYDTSLITTYHGFCVRVLREDIGRLFYPENFQILDEMAQKRILEEIYTEMEIKLDRSSFENILDKLRNLKADSSYVDDLIHGRYANKQGETLEETILYRYMTKQKKVFGLDFDDLISFAFAIFERFPAVLQKWQDRLHYIQVDEFQDSSFRELKLIRLLSEEHRNLFVVGDPDQNIYEWRGADMSILVDFDKTFPGAQTVMLNQNYRSTGNILRAANTLIANNRNRIPKDLFTVGQAGAEVVHLHAKSEEEEGKWIAGEIHRLVREEGRNYREIALLYRSGFLSRFAEQALASAGIPYELYGSLRFYDRMEIKDAIAYLTLILYNDNAAFERVINTPKRSFGKKKLILLRELAAKEGLSLYETLLHHLDHPEFKRSSASEFVRVVEMCRGNHKTLSVSENIEQILVQSGYERYIRENGSMERLDNLSEFKRAAVESERGYGEFYSLEEFLQNIALQAAEGEDDDKADRVKLMTIHSSKGLEFPVCFVCGFTDGIFPSSRTMEERKDNGLEEERRLCFVALTRAMERLYLTESEGNTAAGQTTRKKRPSRFIFEIGEENIQRLGTIPKELAVHAKPESEPDHAPALKDTGTVVNHPIFGRGIITDIDTTKGIYSILFEKGNTVKPVGTDYDFDAWGNLDELRKKALDAARVARETVPKSPVAEETHEKEEPQTGEEETHPGTETIIIEPLDIAYESAENQSPPPKKKEIPPKYRDEDWANTVDSGEINLWKRPDVPKEGWVCIDVIDLGEPVGTCRMCGHQIIRYVHVMYHPEYPRRIGAGCVCAGRMEGDPERARERENAFKNRLARKETFLNMKRKRSRNGNEYIKYKDEIITLISDKFRHGYFKTVCRNRFSPSFPTIEEALADAFDQLDPPVKP